MCLWHKLTFQPLHKWVSNSCVPTIHVQNVRELISPAALYLPTDAFGLSFSFWFTQKSFVSQVLTLYRTRCPSLLCIFQTLLCRDLLRIINLPKYPLRIHSQFTPLHIVDHWVKKQVEHWKLPGDNHKGKRYTLPLKSMGRGNQKQRVPVAPQNRPWPTENVKALLLKLLENC